MAVTYPRIIDEIYYGTFTPEHAKMVLQVREAKSVPALKHTIYNFPYELLMRSLDEQKRILDIIEEEGLDLNQYIGELRDYQTVGTAFLYLSPRSCLGDGCGLGKTAEIAALINILRQKGQLTRFLIAVENSAIGQIQVELMKFTGLNVIALPSESDKMRRAIKKYNWNKVDGIVIKHSALRSNVLSNWIALNLTPDGKCKIFNTFILDESSVIKRDNTKIYDYTRNICNIVDRVHFLNATTFETNIMDIYYQIDMLDPNMLPKKWRIEKEFCVYNKKTYWVKEPDEHGVKRPVMKFKRERSSYKNQEIFKNRLKLCYFGRSIADVGMDRPHIYKVYEVEPSTLQSSALAKGYRYMEVLNSPSNVPETGIPFDRANVPKLDRLCALLENEFSDSKVMIYCFHIQAQKKIQKELEKIGRKPVILNGDTVDMERLEITAKFNRGEYDVIITNIQKSLNLNGGDVCIFYSAPGNPSKMEQIRARIDRHVDDRVKTFVLLLYKGTDEYRFITQVAKQRGIDARALTIDSKTAIDFFMEALEAEKRNQE